MAGFRPLGQPCIGMSLFGQEADVLSVYNGRSKIASRGDDSFGCRPPS